MHDLYVINGPRIPAKTGPLLATTSESFVIYRKIPFCHLTQMATYQMGRKIGSTSLRQLKDTEHTGELAVTSAIKSSWQVDVTMANSAPASTNAVIRVRMLNKDNKLM
jgi:hypothetical protein